MPLALMRATMIEPREQFVGKLVVFVLIVAGEPQIVPRAHSTEHPCGLNRPEKLFGFQRSGRRGSEIGMMRFGERLIG
jgi:hypothetical protein